MLINPNYGDQRSMNDYKNGFNDAKQGSPSLNISRYYNAGFQDGIKELIREEFESDLQK